MSIRYRQVCLRPPVNDPRCKNDSPHTVWAVYVHEDDPPTGDGIEPISGMLLTSEPVHDMAKAKRVVRWYRGRWLIEEWHRALKEGCKLEQSQLDDAADIQRLAAIVSIISVRMIQLRDLADLDDVNDDELTPTTPVRRTASDDPQALQTAVPWMWIVVVSALTKANPNHLTPRQFWLGIAKQGGYIGRKSDGRPGWKVIWRGWYDISMMVHGAELRPSPERAKKCG